MKIETTPRDDHQVSIVAEFEPELMEKFKRQAARKISKETKISGFRPGKAPYDIVRRLYGDDTIQKEAIEILLDTVYPDVLKEAGIEPGGPGSLEKVISQDPTVLSFVVPLTPQVELGDYQTIHKEYDPPSVPEEEVDQVIKNLRANYSTAEPVDRPVEEGDLVTVKVSGEFSQPGEGEETVAIKERTVQMIVGENEFETDDWPYEDFSRVLVGLNEKDTKEIVYQYPDDYPEEELKAKEVLIKTEVISVKSLHLPELNDEFATSLGEYESVDDLRSAIRQNLEENANREYENSYFNSLVDQIVESSTIKYPPQALEEEIERVKHSLEHDLEDRQLDMPTYLKTLEKDEATFIEEEIKPVAKRRLERSLAMDEIARAESIRLDPQALQREVAGTMEMLQQSDPQYGKLRGTQAQNFAQNLMMETAARMLNHEILNRLKSIATGEAAELLETMSVAEDSSEESPETAESVSEPAAEDKAEVEAKATEDQIEVETGVAEDLAEAEAGVAEDQVEVKAETADQAEDKPELKKDPSTDLSTLAEEDPAEEQPEDKSAEA